MTIEEKAKAYDEALGRARQIKNGEGNWRYSDLVEITPALEEVFSELTESEDERIRKTLVEYFGPSAQLDFIRGVPIQKIRDWLEKQKEQKPAEWSKNDIVFLNEITDFFENKTVRLQHDIDMYAHWLKSLPERFSLQPKSEWSEEDEKMRWNLISAFTDKNNSKVDEFMGLRASKAEILDFLKSLRLTQKDESVDKDKYRYCIEYINPRFPTIDDKLNIRHLRVPDEHGAEMALTIILSFGGKIYALYRGNVKDGKLGEWPTPMIVDREDWYTEDWLEELKKHNGYNHKSVAIDFINYLDSNRPEGKICLSNGECEDIEKAFKENDWAKIMRYVEKYSPSWKPTEEQMIAFRNYIDSNRAKAEASVGGWNNYDAMIRLFEDLKKL